MKFDINSLSSIHSLNKLFFALLLNVIFSITLYSQTSITGTISDDETGEDLIGATVKIKGTSIGCITDINGDFVLKTDLQLPLELEVSYMKV